MDNLTPSEEFIKSVCELSMGGDATYRKLLWLMNAKVHWTAGNC